MRTPGEPDLLLSALAELAALGSDDDRATLEELRGRLAGQRLRVLVAGEAKRGKSTLVNALLGRPVLPMGVTPLTALATTVRHGQDEGATAVFRGGRAANFPLSAIDDLVTERGNPGNRRGLASVTVVVDVPVLAQGAELVDTPGTGSVYAHYTAAAEAALETMDAAVFVLTADPPVSASERELMARVAGLSVTTTRDSPRFAADFTGYLDQDRAADLRVSVGARARRMAESLRDEAVLARHAARSRPHSVMSAVGVILASARTVRRRRGLP